MANIRNTDTRILSDMVLKCYEILEIIEYAITESQHFNVNAVKHNCNDKQCICDRFNFKLHQAIGIFLAKKGAYDIINLMHD